VPSKVRTTKLITLEQSLIRRWLGRFGPLLTADLDRALVTSLSVNPVPFREEGRRDERQRLTLVFGAGGTASLLADLGLKG